jgi:hypothetical protein
MHRTARVRVVDREVVRQPLTSGDPEHLSAGKTDHPLRRGRFRCQQHMPGPQDVDGHDVLGSARGVVRQRGQMHNGGAAIRRAPDGGKVQEFITIGIVKASDLVPEAPQVTDHLDAHMSAMPRNQNAHSPS